MKQEIEKDLAHLKNKGYIPFCRKFNKQESLKEKHKLKEDKLPLYFTGNLKSKIVTVDLNPLHTKKDLLNYSDLSDQISNYSSYKKFCEDFGTHLYDHYNSIRPFDKKWINFFEGFGLSGLSMRNEPTLEEAANFRNSRLQLEYVPYSSEEFDFDNYKNFDQEYLSRRRKMIIDKIINQERDFVFVTGNQKEVQSIFDLNINFHQLPMDNGNFYMGFKEIKGQPFCFLSTFKLRFFNRHKLYGKHCRKTYETLFK